jgi:ADP-ribosylglycohydrolase
MTDSPLPPDHAARMQRVQLALDGLSVGDALGSQFFRPGVYSACFQAKAVPEGRWSYTDDTEMALGIAEVLDGYGYIRQDSLARVFSRRYFQDIYRGYGAGAHTILAAIGSGTPWRDAARMVFGGKGSMGNGSAMRVAPVGAYFADDFEAVVREARASAEVTHAHPEGAAGAIAAAVAAAWAWRWSQDRALGQPLDLLRAALEHTPDGRTREGIARALALPLDSQPDWAAYELGNGSQVTAPDTVPFTLWCAARHLDDYAAALWTTIEGLGDIDTNCAIVGGIVALGAGRESIPQEWLAAREPLDHAAFL